MFGQPQPQYGYPQQGYGYQQPQRQPAQLSSLGDLLAGNSAKAYFGANSQPGDSVTGVIEKIETTQVNDFQTKQPAFWNDGRPKEQIHVIIQTQLRDPSVEDDDGRRSLWVKGWGIQLKAFREACMQAGVKTPKPGDTITETYIGLGERGNAPQPPKVFSFRIEPANGGQPQQPVQQAPQQPVMQQPQQGYAQQQYAPQQPMQAPNQGYAPAPVDPWNPPAQAQPAQPVQLGQPQVDPMKVNQLKAMGKPPQEIAALLGVPVEAVTAVTDQAQPQNHGGSEQMPETGEF